MRNSSTARSWLAAVAYLAATFVCWQGQASAAEPIKGGIANESCLRCHANAQLAVASPDGKVRSLQVTPEKFGKSVHGKRTCVECHTDITETPHKASAARTVNCISCHDKLWRLSMAGAATPANQRLGVVVRQIDHYMKSVHARPNRGDPSHPNAACHDCHAPHYIYPKGSKEQGAWRLSVPAVCGKCHAKERDQYAASVHGKAVSDGRNPTAAVCSDCHSTHDAIDPAQDSGKLAITKTCGGCHAASLATYTETYHGRINTLGFAGPAKCFDCHGGHDVQRVADSRSLMHSDKRALTCQKCHAGATPGFATFEPHGTARDLVRYPAIWIASKFMLLMVAGTFAFFWSHAALWFYREHKERKARKVEVRVKVDHPLEGELQGKRFQRFPLAWRVVHLVVALCLMILALTGMSILYADTAFAPIVTRWLGGPKVEAVIHRTFAVLLAAVFLAQLIYFVVHIVRKRASFDLFGPDSLAPRLQDLWDIFAMFKWFFGMGPKPVFDRWTYWEKFDYWAPFSVVAFIGLCGAMLWVPNVTAAYLPGWVLNVATIFHGEGALLAVLFLFTVHFFNNHFRPEKFPLEVVMFTGSMPLQQFKREHRLEYNRLLASGELGEHLVAAPSQPMTLGSWCLGFALIGFGLLLLVIVLVGVFTP